MSRSSASLYTTTSSTEQTSNTSNDLIMWDPTNDSAVMHYPSHKSKSTAAHASSKPSAHFLPHHRPLYDQRYTAPQPPSPLGMGHAWSLAHVHPTPRSLPPPSRTAWRHRCCTHSGGTGLDGSAVSPTGSARGMVEFAKIECVSVERSNFLRSRRPRFEFLRVVGLKGIRWRWRARVLGSCSLRAGDWGASFPCVL
jgi:hypothetical protein